MHGAAGAGELLLTDYKTGRAPSTAKLPATRRRHLLERVRAGTSLQALAYLLAAGAGARGRYLYLRPDLEERELAIGADDSDLPEFHAAFAGAVAAALGVWDAGAFFPRLVDPSGTKEPPRCASCEVAEACLRGDSGSRSRLVEWADAAGGAAVRGEIEDPVEGAVRALWVLPGPARDAAPAGAEVQAEAEAEGHGEDAGAAAEGEPG